MATSQMVLCEYLMLRLQRRCLWGPCLELPVAQEGLPGSSATWLGLGCVGVQAARRPCSDDGS